MTTYPSVLVRGEQCDGRVGIVESVMPSGAAGPPLHIHDFDEAFYVLEGELTFHVGGKLVTAEAGELAFAPGGEPHAFTNRGPAEARFLIVCTPAGFEREFARRAARKEGSRPARLGAGGHPAGHTRRADDRRDGLRLTGMRAVEVRPVEEEYLPAAERASTETFLEADRHNLRVGDGEAEPRAATQSKRWTERMRFYLHEDPRGCWVATCDQAVVGFAISQNRERLWYLATYAVLPDYQGGGIGRHFARGTPGLRVDGSTRPRSSRRWARSRPRPGPVSRKRALPLRILE